MWVINLQNHVCLANGDIMYNTFDLVSDRSK